MAGWFLGEIRMFGGNAAPAGWMMCDGSALNINDYDELYALIGTAYGSNGANTFRLPDLRGRLPVGQGAAPGLTRRVMGQQFGVNGVALTDANLPAHLHAINASDNIADAVAPGPTLTLGTISQDPAVSLFYGASTVGPTPIAKQAFSSQAFGSIGKGTPHTNQMCTLSINYIIAVAGMFPSQG